MASKRLERHQARRANLAESRGNRVLVEAPRSGQLLVVTTSANADVFEPLSIGDRARDAQLFTLPSVNEKEIDDLLNKMRRRWTQEQQSMLLDSCKRSVLRSISGPFGLGSVAAGWDKAGGNVTTQHNADQGVFAREKETYTQKEYQGTAYKRARDCKKDAAIIENSGMVRDEYSGELLDYPEVDCDHIVSTCSYHQKGGWRQTASERAEFGADPENLALTSRAANRSMKNGNKHDWQKKPSKGNPDQTNKEAHGHDNRRVNPAVKRGEEAARRHSPTTTERYGYDAKRVALTGAAEAGKMGLQQSVGLLLQEFFAASFDEITDAWRNGISSGMQPSGFAKAVAVRVRRVAKQVGARWKDAFSALGGGIVSGLLSNIATWLINMVATTGKRMVRLIREGMMSILNALKMAVFPSSGMSRAEAADAATKLLVTGVAVSLGIVLEEAVQQGLAAVPLLAPMAATISAVIVGAGTGVVTALLVAGLDQLDVFGVQGKRREQFILSVLDERIKAVDLEISSGYEAEVLRLGQGIATMYPT